MRSIVQVVLVLAPVMCCPPVARGQGPVHVVLLAYRVVNSSRTDADSATAHCVLPASNRYQEVIELRIDPKPSEEDIDGEGQRVVTVPLGKIPAGTTRAVRVLAWVRLKRLTVPLVRSAAKVEPLPEVLSKAYLKDAPPLQLEKVEPIATEAVGTRTRDIDRARALYNHMAEHCRYDIDEQFDTAAAVLDGKPASCSELAYTYVALCRAVDIPARIVSAFVNREGTSPSVDWRCHRWAEFYADGIGWVPVDPTNRLNHPSKNFFGRQEGKYLVAVDDGVGSPIGLDPGWLIFAAFAEPRSVFLQHLKSAVWRVSSQRRREADFFGEATKVLSDPDLAARRQAVGQWAHRRETLKTAFLLEALFDAEPDVRKIAAVALGEANDISVMLPLMRQADVEPEDEVKRALIDAARRLLKSAGEEQRVRAVGDLAKSRTDEGLKLLDGIWDDKARDVRKAAAQYLYKFGDKPAVHAGYRTLIDDDDDFIRVLAALRWARVGSHEALKELVEHLESANSWDRENALAELEKRTGDDFGFKPRSRPTLRRNREAIARFDEWLEDHPDAK